MQSACDIPPNDELFLRYHNEEWGVPATRDQVFFEKICLEGFQAGLSWQTILHKRADFRRAFDGFNAEAIRQFTESDVERLMGDASIVRNRRKILSTINNARQLLSLQAEFGSLASFFWSFEPLASNRPNLVDNEWLNSTPFTNESMSLSQALKKRGWSFIGPTNIYATMQALGIVNDHVDGCPRRIEIDNMRKTLQRPTITCV